MSNTFIIQGYAECIDAIEHSGTAVSIVLNDTPAFDPISILCLLGLLSGLVMFRGRHFLQTCLLIVIILVMFTPIGGADLTVLTNSDGYYQLTHSGGESFEPGWYTISFRRTNYFSEYVQIEIVEDGSYIVDVPLAVLCPIHPRVTLTDMNTYYAVQLDYTTGVSNYEMGQVYGIMIKKNVPDIEQKMDAYLAELTSSDYFYNICLTRTNIIKSSIPIAYYNEIDGIASELSGGTTNVRGDGLLSVDEFFLLNLVPDVIRTHACSAIGVYGSRSDTGNPMTARLLDWYAGSQQELTYYQAVVTIKNGSQSICLIGYLGYMGVLTGCNDDGVFAGILDSSTGAAYSANGKRSYPIDLRYALENYTTVDAVGTYLSNPSRNYTYNHNIILSDMTVCKVLENNFSGDGSNMQRALRTDLSSLNPGIIWDFNNAVSVVNSFILEGNHDNHTGVTGNEARWFSFRQELGKTGPTATFDELKRIAGYDGGDGPGSASQGDIFTSGNRQIVVFEPNPPHLQVFFREASGLPDDPIFETVPISF